ncbi:MAG TPA: hypothetical protein VHH72_09725 [Solirubrobacterales bacterium]|jgi:hypothetical protein|nr:hypothetical protein [Solirubrobacterales bacterium]
MAAGRLSQGRLIAGVAAVLLFILMFIPWFEIPGVEAQLPEEVTSSVDLSGTPGIESQSVNAWEAENPLDVYLLITILITLAGVALAATGRGGSATLMPLSAVTFLLGAIGTIQVLYQVFDVPGDLTRKVGLFLGLIAVAGIAVGGYLSMSEEGGAGERY